MHDLGGSTKLEPDAETVCQQREGWPGESPVLAQRAVSEDPRWTRAVGGLIRAILGKHQRASLEELSLVARCDLVWDKARPRAKSLSWQTRGGRVKYLPGLGG